MVCERAVTAGSSVHDQGALRRDPENRYHGQWPTNSADDMTGESYTALVFVPSSTTRQGKALAQAIQARDVLLCVSVYLVFDLPISSCPSYSLWGASQGLYLLLSTGAHEVTRVLRGVAGMGLSSGAFQNLGGGLPHSRPTHYQQCPVARAGRCQSTDMSDPPAGMWGEVLCPPHLLSVAVVDEAAQRLEIKSSSLPAEVRRLGVTALFVRTWMPSGREPCCFGPLQTVLYPLVETGSFLYSLKCNAGCRGQLGWPPRRE